MGKYTNNSPLRSPANNIGTSDCSHWLPGKLLSYPNVEMSQTNYKPDNLHGTCCTQTLYLHSLSLLTQCSPSFLGVLISAHEQVHTHWLHVLTNNIRNALSSVGSAWLRASALKDRLSVLILSDLEIQKIAKLQHGKNYSANDTRMYRQK